MKALSLHYLVINLAVRKGKVHLLTYSSDGAVPFPFEKYRIELRFEVQKVDASSVTVSFYGWFRTDKSRKLLGLDQIAVIPRSITNLPTLL
jgi:hypothetical protein